MTLHKLSAGSGYEYLTRQVAALDSTEKRRVPLADYYAAKGEAAGHWVGTGLSGIEGIDAGDVVTAEQMKLLFGAGCDPTTGAPLGRKYAIYGTDGVNGFNTEVAHRLAASSNRDSATVRSEVAREFFLRDRGREPRNTRELSAAVARYSRPRQTAVAGFDLTFSPVKSVSALWAIAPRDVAAVIEAAHDAAVADALALVEREVLFTREGKDGACQVETRGLIGAAFTHRDSRAGDPDLHTHVAVANKVQTREGKWLAIYGRLLHEQAVSVSETYNTALERHLSERLGIQFAERSPVAGKRPVREITGVDSDLCAAWSRRRTDIVRRQRSLARQFQQTHGRPPTRTEEIALAQQANLETREAKHDPRSLAEQRTTWRTEAVDVLGSDEAVERMTQAALHPQPGTAQQVSTEWVRATAEHVIGEVESRRATWQVWHLRAEAQRQVRDVEVPAGRVGEVVEWIVDDAIERLSINLTPDRDPIGEPATLRRSDGVSVYRHSGRDHYTSRRVLDAEQRIIAAAGRVDGFAWPAQEVELTVLAARLEGWRLNPGQERLVEVLATSGRRVALALAPAGSGKTTALRVLANVWIEGGCSVLGLAPSAAAAAALSGATGMPAETLAKLAYDLSHDPSSPLVARIGAGTLVVIDEAGMADTLTLATIIDAALGRGASVRLIGDDQQLAAIGAGGVLRDLANTHGAARLDEVVRFADPIEAEASLALRDGNRSALGFYLDRDRVHVGDIDTCLAEVFLAWQQESLAGRDCLMLAPTRELVAALNAHARDARLDGRTPDTEVALADGNHASVGDLVTTRRNDRRLGVSGTDWVKNGDRWTVTGIRDGRLALRHNVSGLRATLPSEYVGTHVDLGYASTVHTAQGLTADVIHGVVTGEESRQVLYTMLTRGRIANHAHVVVAGASDPHELMLPGLVEQMTATEMLEGILAHDGAAVSATTTASIATSPQAGLHDATVRYADAVAVAANKMRVSDDEPGAAGPLPWLPGVPEQVAGHPDWGAYLAARARLVTDLAEQVRTVALDAAPDWSRPFGDILTPELRGEISVWRAAAGVPDGDRSLAGPEPSGDAEAAYRRRLIRRVNERYGEVVAGWERTVIAYVGEPDAHTIELAQMLERLQRRGVDAEQVLARAAARGPLPDDHAAAALAYRIRAEFSPQKPVQDSRPSRRRHIEPPPPMSPNPPNQSPGIGF